MILHLASQRGEFNDDDDDNVINLVLRNSPINPLAFGLVMTTKMKMVLLTIRVISKVLNYLLLPVFFALPLFHLPWTANVNSANATRNGRQAPFLR